MTKLSFNHFSKNFSSFNWRKILGIFLLVLIISLGIIIPLSEIKAKTDCDYTSMPDCQDAQKEIEKVSGKIIKGCYQPDTTKQEYCFEWEVSIGGAFVGSLKEAIKTLTYPFEWIIYQILHWIVWAIWFILGGLLALMGGFLDAALLIKNFTQNVPMIREGWGLVRDLCNIFFVLILLIIAFATILRIETYGIKQLLPNLIIAVLLINFSMVICGVIIDFAQILMFSFIPADGSGYSEILAHGLKLEETFQHTWTIHWDALAGQVFATILVFGSVLAFGAVAIFLIIRVVALWLLIVFSPAAWFGWVLPATRQIWSSWWNIFLKYVFYGPIAIFCLWLTAHLAKSEDLAKQIEFTKENLSDISSVGAIETTGTWLSGLILPFINYVFIIVLLIASIIVARTFGIYGAQGVIGAAKWFAKGAGNMVDRWVAKGAKIPGTKLLTKGLRKLGLEKPAKGLEAIGRAKEKVMPWVSPGAWKRAWEARRKDIEARAFARPAGGLRDQLNYIFSLGKKRTKFAEEGEQGEINRRKKEIGETSRTTEYLLDGLQRAIAAGDRIDTSAYLRLIFEQNDQNEGIKQTKLGDKYNHIVSDENVTDMVYQALGRVGFTKEQQAKTAMDLGNIAFMSGNYAHFAMGRFNEKTHRFEKQLTMDDQRKAAAAKATNLESQTKDRNWHWNSIMEEDKDGNPVKLHDGGRALLMTITAGDIEQLNRTRPDFQTKVGSEKAVKDMREFADTLEPTDPVRAGLIKRFAAQLHVLRTAEMPDWYDESKYGELRWLPARPRP